MAARPRPTPTGTVSLLVTLLPSLLLGACANAASPAAEPRAERASAVATSEPSETETPAPAVVAGERIPAAHWVNSSSLLTHRAAAMGSGDAVLPLADEVATWLDAHLNDLQQGGTGRTVDVAAPGLVDDATPAELDAITGALATPETPVTSARYLLDGSYDAMTEWLEATVEVTRVDGTVALATFVFTPTDAGPQLVLFGPADTFGGEASAPEAGPVEPADGGDA